MRWEASKEKSGKSRAQELKWRERLERGWEYRDSRTWALRRRRRGGRKVYNWVPEGREGAISKEEEEGDAEAA